MTETFLKPFPHHNMLHQTDFSAICSLCSTSTGINKWIVSGVQGKLILKQQRCICSRLTVPPYSKVYSTKCAYLPCTHRLKSVCEQMMSAQIHAHCRTVVFAQILDTFCSEPDGPRWWWNSKAFYSKAVTLLAGVYISFPVMKGCASVNDVGYELVRLFFNIYWWFYIKNPFCSYFVKVPIVVPVKLS